MTKQEIRSLITNLLPKYDKTAKFHSRFLDAAIEKALAEFYNVIFLRNPLELQRYTYGMGYTTPLPIAYEASSGLYYANYLSGYSIIPIPDKASGCRRVSTPTQGGASFFPIDSREMDLIRNSTYVDEVTGKFGYVTARTRLEFYNLSAAVIASGIRADILIPFSNYADTDVVLVPELTGDQGEGFTDRVLKILQTVQPVDLKDDNKDQEGKQ